jgi:hypothetical protein
LDLKEKIKETIQKVSEDLDQVKYLPPFTIQVVGSLAKGTRTNLYSTPTLDLEVSSDAEPFGLRDQFTKVFNLTTS